jgi:hypothetical protein
LVTNENLTIDSLLRLPLANPRDVLDGLQLRYKELCARKDFLPYEFNLRLPSSLNLDTILSQLPPTYFTAPSPDPKSATPAAPAPAATATTSTTSSNATPNRVALALALCGWQGLTNPRLGAVPNTASCHSCLRRLGLWMFKSKEVADDGTVLVPAPMDHLDPVREHRFFCPWRNPAAQRNPGRDAAGSRRNTATSADADLAGWELTCLVIKNDAYLRSVEAKRKSGIFRLSRPTTPAAAPAENATPSALGTPLAVFGPDGLAVGDADAEDEKVKDKERWARLRRVKSLFDTKGVRKLRRSTVSRPGTGYEANKAAEAGKENTTQPTVTPAQD